MSKENRKVLSKEGIERRNDFLVIIWVTAKEAIAILKTVKKDVVTRDLKTVKKIPDSQDTNLRT